MRETWPNQQVEIKGSWLTEKQTAELIRLLLPYETLVQFVALDTHTHPDGLVEVLKNRQADAVTAHITRQHHPNPIHHLHQLGESVRTMPNQLFLQTVATWELVMRTIREATLYYVQRQPSELGDISWTIDRKDKDLTQMEDTWSTLILPLSETEFLKEPLICLRDADYSQFDARYGINPATADAEMRSHWEWLESMSGVPPTRVDTLGTDIKRLLTEQRSFGDSRSNLGLQLADMLSSILRRALNGNLQESGWGEFGGLLVRQNYARTGIIQLGPGNPTPVLGQAQTVWKTLNQKAKNMILGASDDSL